MTSKIIRQKSKIILVAVFLQTLFTASLSGQKYENGTRLLKGAEVLSATPLQLDYVLEKLADTAKITVNLHEGKTHLVLDDGSGKWREWWYIMGKWQLKTTAETDPTIPVHVKSISGENITSWNRASANSHFHGNKNTIDGITSVNIAQWGSAYTWGNHAAQGYLKIETDPVWSAAKENYYTKSNLQTAGRSQVHWDNITNKPSTAGGYGITDVYTKAETRTLTGDTAKVLRQLIKSGSVTETDPTIPQHVKGITSANIINWTNAFNWGNHAAQGYLETETDPTVPQHVKGITSTNLSNWNTAYGWGNHAAQGYLKNYTLPVTSSSVLGGVKIGSRLSVTTDGTVSANPQSWTEITGKPSFATVAASGSYNDLKDRPTIPAVNNSTISFTQGGVSKGSITLNQPGNQTVALDAQNENILDITGVEKPAGYKVYGRDVYVKAFGNSGSIMDDNTQFDNPAPQFISSNISSIVKIYGYISEKYGTGTKTIYCPVNGRIWYNYENKQMDIQWLCWVEDSYLRFRYIKSGAQAPSGSRSYVIAVEYTKF